MRNIKNLKKIVQWICENIKERKIDTADATLTTASWLSKFGTTVRDVERGQYDKKKLTWNYDKLVSESDGFLGATNEMPGVFKW